VSKTAATNAGVPLANYSGVCLTFLRQVDLFGIIGGMTVFCDTLSLDVSGLAHEFGHGYGLDHSRIYGSTSDYQDPWDVMSDYNAYIASNQEFGTMGPGLNAYNMWGRGWLDETRCAFGYSGQAIQLRPLHRTDLTGFLYAQLLMDWGELGIPTEIYLVSSEYHSAGTLRSPAPVFLCIAFRTTTPT
jgi:hypothetical protein